MLYLVGLWQALTDGDHQVGGPVLEELGLGKAEAAVYGQLVAMPSATAADVANALAIPGSPRSRAGMRQDVFPHATAGRLARYGALGCSFVIGVMKRALTGKLLAKASASDGINLPIHPIASVDGAD